MSQPLDYSVTNPKEGGASYPLSHRIFRAIWGVVWNVFGIWTPVPFHGWRRFLVNLFGGKIHKTAKIYPNVKIWYPPNLEMKEFSCLASDVNCYCMDKILLNEYALVSQGAHLCAGTHDIDNENFQLVTKPITIGTNAWIAAEAFVGPGVTVGENAVLGARAVAFKDLDANCVYVGNPAKLIRARKINDE